MTSYEGNIQKHRPDIRSPIKPVKPLGSFTLECSLVCKNRQCLRTGCLAVALSHGGSGHREAKMDLSIILEPPYGYFFTRSEM